MIIMINASNFYIQAFLGHKYGYVDLPSTLQPKDYEAIRFELVRKYDTDKMKLLQEWYKKDVNENPPEGLYILQPMDSILGDNKLYNRLQIYCF